MRVPIRSFRETISVLVRTRTGIYSTSMWSGVQTPENKQYPRQQQCKHTKYYRFERQNSARLRILILVVISSTEPRAQAVFTAAAAVQTSEMFVVLAVFEALHSLMLHDESSFCNTGTRDFTGTRTYCRILTVSATSCVVSTKCSIFFILLRLVFVW